MMKDIGQEPNKRLIKQLVDERLKYKIIKTIIDDFDHYREYPQHLAFAMMNYSLVNGVENRVFNDTYKFDFDTCSYPTDTGNLHHYFHSYPKYKNITADKSLQKKDSTLFHDALIRVNSSSYHEFPDTDPNLPLEGKVNKTMDEWVELFTNIKFDHTPTISDTFGVNEYLLCLSSNSSKSCIPYKWNRQGFIANILPYGTDKAIFSGYTRCEKEIPEEIKSRIVMIKDHPLIQNATEEYLRKAQENVQRIYAGESRTDVLEGISPETAAFWKEMEEWRQFTKDLKLKDPDRFKQMMAKLQKEIDNSTEELKKLRKFRRYNHLCSHSNLVIMPTNAHISYVIAGIEISETIIKNPKQEEYAKKYARTFLRKWDK